MKSFSEKKKLNKIQSIFDRDIFERVGIDHTVDRWFKLLGVLDALKAGDPLSEPVQLLIESVNLGTLAEFSSAFTEYNNIRIKLQTHCLLELWTCFMLFFAVFEASTSRNSKIVWGFFDSAVGYLIQSSFYVSLIVIKAIKNKLLTMSKSRLEAYSKALQKLNYETGIPLIKTLKINNELVVYNLKKG